MRAGSQVQRTTQRGNIRQHEFLQRRAIRNCQRRDRDHDMPRLAPQANFPEHPSLYHHGPLHILVIPIPDVLQIRGTLYRVLLVARSGKFNHHGTSLPCPGPFAPNNRRTVGNCRVHIHRRGQIVRDRVSGGTYRDRVRSRGREQTETIL